MIRVTLLLIALAACGGKSNGAPASKAPPIAEATPDAAEQQVVPPAQPRAEAPAPTPPPAAGDGLPDGAPCLTGSACASGVCEGEGCADDTPGTCMPSARMCTYDLRPYCGCDGTTFQASGTCPGRRFSRREPCEGLPTP